MNDFKLIYENSNLITTDYVTNVHKEHLDWLTTELKQNVPTIVITHHLPSKLLSHDKYRPYDYMSSAFWSDLEYLQNDNILYWICGHTHTYMNLNINKSVYLANPFGNEIECKEKELQEIIIKN